MSASRTTHLDRFWLSPSHRLTKALGRLQIQSSSPILGSLYVYDLVEQRTLSASCSIAAMLGYSADAIHRMEAVGIGNLIHPDDLHLVSQHYQRFATLRSSDVIRSNYRMKRADGAWCWLHSQETPLEMAHNRFPLQIVGVVQLMPRFAASSLEDN